MDEIETIQKEKVLKQLKVSYDMYENTKKETEKKMKEALNDDGTKKYNADDIKKELSLLNEAQDDVVKQYIDCGGKEEDIRKKGKKKASLTQHSQETIIDVAEIKRNMEADRKK